MTSATPRLREPRFDDAERSRGRAPPGDAPDLARRAFHFVCRRARSCGRTARVGEVRRVSLETNWRCRSKPRRFRPRSSNWNMAEGRLHISAFNTGAVPSAVSSCGFVPFCTVGQDDGTFGTTMQVIVPAKSPIKSIKELKGHTMAFTTRDSNSGCKCPGPDARVRLLAVA